MDSDMAKNDFGVPGKKATFNRPAYSPGSSTSLEGGIGLLFELTPNWLVAANMAIEWFDDNAYDSPIVEDRYVIKGFGAVNYVF